MNLRPIVERELGVTARLWATYRNRMLTPVAVAGLAVAKALLNGPPGRRVLTGADLFHTLTFLMVAFCVLEGVRKTADCLSQERREGTLGLLFLTHLNGADIVLGKLLSASLTSFYGLFAMLPILAWTLLMGGVRPGEVWRAGLAAASVLLFSLTAGIWVSARSRSASHAMMGTLAVVLSLMVVPVVAQVSWLVPLSPAAAMLNVNAAQYAQHTLAFWVSLILTPVISWALLSHAAFTITHFRDADGAVQESSSGGLKHSGDRRRRAKLRARLLAVNPVCWLANRGHTSRALLWLLVLIGGAGIGWGSYYSGVQLSASLGSRGLLRSEWLLVFFAMLINGAMKILIGSQASRCLAEARRNTALELLLCAPLTVKDILQGQVMALRRTFLLPMLTLLCFELLGLYFMINGHLGNPSITPPQQPQEFLNAVVFGEAGFVIFFLVDFQAVAWSGMWFGLCSRNESRATFKTVLYVILLPHLMLILFCLGAGLFLAWPIVCLVWARLKLQEHFRFLAGNHLTSSGEINGWVPFELPDLSEGESVGVQQGV